MGVKLTREQREAVENRGGSLLVSAAAGSGKTKVLVERLFRYLTDADAPADVTEFLIITYTKAAAAELKMKIASELSERLAEDADNLHLHKQALLIYRADVRTVDSFCTNLLRENIHLVGGGDCPLTPDFRVLDEQEAALLRTQVLERVLETFYSRMEEGDGASALADTIGAGRDDSALAALVLQIYEKLQSHAYPLRWIAAQENYWAQLPETIDDTPYGRELMGGAKQILSYWEEMFSALCREMEEDTALSEKYLPAFLSAREKIRSYLELLEQGWDAACEGDLSFERLKAVRGENALKEHAKSLWDLCKKDCEKILRRFSVTNEEMRADLARMAPAMGALLRLCGDFAKAYAAEKLRRNVTDFSDQEHFALELLVDENGAPTALGKSVSERYREIMIDEFQDTNEVQNQIFSAVSRGGKNLFMVGDMKQSIYRFRLADPTIFLRHYQSDPMFDQAQEGQERKVLLSKNFRSRAEILDAANFLCANLMSEEIGEMRYTQEEALHFGAEYYVEKEGCQTEFYLVDHVRGEGETPGDEVKCAETEARFVARRIRALLDEPFLVQGEDGALRPVREEDIVILLRSPLPRQKLYERVLAEEGIACAAESAGDFFATMEIAVTYAMLQLIDNPHQDVPLISVLRSPIFAFSPDRLAQIRASCPRGDFYTALTQDPGEDAARFLKDLRQLRFLAPDMSVHRLLWHLYNRWNVLGVFGAMEGGAERREHLIALYEHARHFENAGYRGLFSFVSHLRALLESGEGLQTTSSSARRGVRLMSIHKSKGLEFPVVILAELNKSFHKSDLLAPVLVHPELGLGPVCIDLDRHIRYPTVAKDAVAQRQVREQKSEEMRVLYVALTRAKEKLILVSAMRNAAGAVKKLLPRASCPAAGAAVAGCDSMAQWVLLPLLCRTEADPLRRAAGMEGRAACNDGMPWHIEWVDGAPCQQRRKKRLPVQQEAGQELPFDPALLTFRYPYEAEAQMPSKLTATQLKGRLIDQRVAEDAPPEHTYAAAFRSPRFLEHKRGLNAAERGTAMHQAMQFLDFSKTGSLEEICGEIARMERQRFLTAEQAAAVDCGQIAALFASPLGRELRGVPPECVWREYRFSVLEPVSKYLPEDSSGDEILLQGAVDCFFETEHGLTVVDFKTDRVAPGEESRRADAYRVQLTAYSDVLERIFEKPVCRRILYFFATGRAVLI